MQMLIRARLLCGGRARQAAVPDPQPSRAVIGTREDEDLFAFRACLQ